MFSLRERRVSPRKAASLACCLPLGGTNRKQTSHTWIIKHLDYQTPGLSNAFPAVLFLQVLDPYRTQTFALRRRLVNSNGLDRARLIGSYIQVRLFNRHVGVRNVTAINSSATCCIPACSRVLL